jgi:hypothetical protein
MIDIDKPCEGLDYEIRPLGIDNEQAWMVELLRGPFSNCVLAFNHIQFDGHANTLKYQFHAWSTDQADSSDGNVTHLDNTDPVLEDFAFKILQDVIRNGIANGSIDLYDNNTEN